MLYFDNELILPQLIHFLVSEDKQKIFLTNRKFQNIFMHGNHMNFTINTIILL